MRPLTVVPVPGHGAEDVLVVDGLVYTGTEDGSVFRLRTDGSRIDRVGFTGGRPLGLELMPDGRLLVADADRGLLALDPYDGGIESLVTSVSGRRMRFCNNAAVAADGDIWFSDSSTVYGISQWKKDFVEDTRTGRLLVRRATGLVEVVLEGLAFSNGVALAADESYVAVAESGARTVVRHWLSGPRAGERDLLADDLPGYPDNISRGSDGLIWVSIASPVDRVVERLHRSPVVLRRQLTPHPGRAPAEGEAHRAGAGVRRRRPTRARPRGRRVGVPHGHRRPGARRPGVAGLAGRARGCLDADRRRLEWTVLPATPQTRKAGPWVISTS